MPGGYNHYWDCGCPFCVRRRWAGSGAQASISQMTLSYTAVTIPNARCPVCGDAVFFYKSPTGGRVFFDELGPPWPKHPCTDSTPQSGSHPAASNLSTRSSDPSWVREGWTPMRVVSITEGAFELGQRMISDWWVVAVRSLRSGRATNFLIDADIGLRGDSLLYISEWNARGVATLSWFASPPGEVIEYQAWHPDHYAGVTIARFRELADFGDEVRGTIALRNLVESLVGTSSAAPLDSQSIDRIVLMVDEAIRWTRRDGWQRHRDDADRIESAVRNALGALDRGWLESVMTLARATY